MLLFDSQIDFHAFGEMSREEIDYLLNQFLDENAALKNRTLLIITGKGEVVRPEIERLLKKDKRVLEYESAGYTTGQHGAFIVKLKQ